MRPLSRHFAKIHGVDVSDEMIRLAARTCATRPTRTRTRLRARTSRCSPTSVRFRLLLRRVPAHPQPRRGVPIPARGAPRAARRAASCAARSTAFRRTPSSTTPGAACASRRRRSPRFARDARFPTAGAGADLDAVHVDHLPQEAGRLDASGSARQGGPARGTPAGDPQHQQRAHRRSRGAGHRPDGGALAVGRGPARGLRPQLTWRSSADGRACRLTYIGEPGAGRRLAGECRSCPRASAPAWCRSKSTWLGRPLCAPAWVRIIPAGPAVPRDSQRHRRRQPALGHPHRQPGGESDDDGSGRMPTSSAPRWTAWRFARHGFLLRGPDLPALRIQLPPAGEPGARAARVRIALGKRAFAPVAIEVV